MPGGADEAGGVEGEDHDEVEEEREGHDGGGADAWVGYVDGWFRGEGVVGEASVGWGGEGEEGLNRFGGCGIGGGG